MSSFTSLRVLEYPWNEVGTVCDIGASIGTFSIPLSKAHPHLKIIDQDLEAVLAKAKNVGVWAVLPRPTSTNLNIGMGKRSTRGCSSTANRFGTFELL